MEAKKVNILVIDDEKDACIFVMKILSVKKDWQVDIAWKNTMALELLEKRAYDAVIFDYRMSSPAGVELIRRIREKQPDVRVVFHTRTPTIDNVYPAIEAGAERVLAKPVDPAELVSVLEEQLAEQNLLHHYNT